MSKFWNHTLFVLCFFNWKTVLLSSVLLTELLVHFLQSPKKRTKKRSSKKTPPSNNFLTGHRTFSSSPLNICCTVTYGKSNFTNKIKNSWIVFMYGFEISSSFYRENSWTFSTISKREEISWANYTPYFFLLKNF